MKLPIKCLALAGIVLAATLPRCVAVSVEKTNSTADISPDGFRIISQKNIFNANRRPGITATAPTRPQRPPTRIEAFSLLGTMLHEGGRFAFFDGSDSQYKKVLKAGDLIAGYKITEVTNDCVKLDGDGGQMELTMGMQMSRRDEGKWQILVGAASSAPSSGGSSLGMNDRRDRVPSPPGLNGRDRRSTQPSDGGSRRGRRDRGSGFGTTGGTDNSGTNSIATVEPDEEPVPEPAAEPSTNSAADEILKRLMQKREKENK